MTSTISTLATFHDLWRHDGCIGYSSTGDAARSQLRPPAGDAADPNYVPPAGDAVDPNCVPLLVTRQVPWLALLFTIEFNDGSFLKEGQTVFVSTTAAVGSSIPTRTPLTRSRRSLSASSELHNDQTAPTISSDGQ